MNTSIREVHGLTRTHVRTYPFDRKDSSTIVFANCSIYQSHGGKRRVDFLANRHLTEIAALTRVYWIRRDVSHQVAEIGRTIDRSRTTIVTRRLIIPLRRSSTINAEKMEFLFAKIKRGPCKRDFHRAGSEFRIERDSNQRLWGFGGCVAQSRGGWRKRGSSGKRNRGWCRFKDVAEENTIRRNDGNAPRDRSAGRVTSRRSLSLTRRWWLFIRTATSRRICWPSWTWCRPSTSIPP